MIGLLLAQALEGSHLALALAKQGKSVCLIEAGSHLGGLLYGFDFGAFKCDHGTQNFDFRSSSLASFVSEILPNGINLTPWKWQSQNGNQIAQQVEMPPLSRDSLSVLIDEAIQSHSPITYSDKIRLKFGPTLADIIPYQWLKNLLA